MDVGLDDNIAMGGDAQRSWHGQRGSNGWWDQIYSENERDEEIPAAGFREWGR